MVLLERFGMADNGGQAKGTGRGRLSLWPFALIAVVMGFALFGERGVVHMLRLNNQKADLLQELSAIEQQNSALQDEIQALRSDRRTIERLARTALGMVREDELVFQFPSRTEKPSPADSASSR